MSTVSQGSPQTFTLPAGQTLTVTSSDLSTGSVYPFAERVGDTAGLTAVAANSSAVLGPYATDKRYQVACDQGALAVAMATVDFPTAAEALAAAAAAAAVLYLPVVSGAIGDVCELIGAGAPTDGTTGATIAGKGSRYTDITNGKLYINSGAGTKAVPAWKIVTSA